MIVTWVLDNGSYEVSSKEHLLQIMQSGSLFQNAGSVPPNYRSVNFVQTADIDLESDIANIRVISSFSGTYDGQGFAVSNWSCTPQSGKGTAFFGSTVGAIVKNMVLNGIWKTYNVDDGAFLAGHNTNSQFYNITADFAPGTEITAIRNSLGGLFAYTGACTLRNITLAGTIDKFEGKVYTGGVVGFSGYSSGSTFLYIRNIASFTTGIVNTGDNVGGIFGHFGQGDNVSHVINAMRGSIQGPKNTGGISAVFSSGTLNYACNSMIGDLMGSNSSAIAAVVSGGGTSTHVVSYMTGDVTSGFMGTVSSTVFTSCIVAMSGSTTHAAFRSGHGLSQVLLDESYGITYTSSSGTVETMDTSTFETSPSFELPCWDLSFVDSAYNSLEWPFVFGNVGTTTAHDWMVKVGFGTDASFVGANDLSVAGPQVSGPNFAAVPGVFFVDLTWTAKDMAVSYRIQCTGSDGSMRTFVTSATRYRVRSLTPDTEYGIGLFSSAEGGFYTAYGSSVISTTLENLSTNYNTADLQDVSGNIDLSSLRAEELETLEEHINDLFENGTKVVHRVKNRSVKATFVKQGSSVPSTNSAILAPFSKLSGGQQAFTLTTTGGSIEVGYDEVNDHVIVNGQSYSDGEYLVVDGKKMNVSNV